MESILKYRGMKILIVDINFFKVYDMYIENWTITFSTLIDAKTYIDILKD